MGEIKYDIMSTGGEGRAPQGRGELRDQPQPARSCPMPGGLRERASDTPSGATRDLSVTVYDHGED
ncbi:hypothetical protein [Streptomyces sp. SLBN-8D4]|jgi:hypothetical protein|uniref:hypothetical protein n=1 Tax=Streptomyces sp. SLBN-8D4 TaxID=3377728 RepID=UPI003C7EAB29